MSRVFSFIALLLVVALGLWYYATQIRTITHEGTQPLRAPIDVTGVRMDLLRIVQAERQHFAMQGRYMSLQEMRDAGDTGLPEDERAGYRYRVEATGAGFEATATFEGSAPQGLPRVFSAGPDGEVHQEE